VGVGPGVDVLIGVGEGVGVLSTATAVSDLPSVASEPLLEFVDPLGTRGTAQAVNIPSTNSKIKQVSH